MKKLSKKAAVTTLRVVTALAGIACISTVVLFTTSINLVATAIIAGAIAVYLIDDCIVSNSKTMKK